MQTILLFVVRDAATPREPSSVWTCALERDFSSVSTRALVSKRLFLLGRLPCMHRLPLAGCRLNVAHPILDRYCWASSRHGGWSMWPLQATASARQRVGTCRAFCLQRPSF